jgi:ribosome modulation factor
MPELGVEEAPMGRKKNQTDIEDTISTATGGNGVGHNSKLTDDERRALTLHHLGLYVAADALVERAKTDRKAIADQARADLGKGVMSDIRDMIVAKDEKTAKGNIERALRVARWMGLPVGTQVSMFDLPVDDRAKSDGTTAGMEGKICDPPRHFAVAQHQDWIAGWHEGQQILAGAFKKLGTQPPAAPAQQAAAQ